MLTRNAFQKVVDGLEQMPAVALLGPRQVGKTTLALAVAKTRDSVYLDLESPEDLLKLTDPLSFLNAQAGKLVILDEIQCAPNLFKVLRGLIDQRRRQGHRTGQFLILGSASTDLLRQSSESLAGRMSYVDMCGLNVLEAQDQSYSRRQHLWLRGGFPDSYLAASHHIAMDWLENLIRTYLERDIPQMGFRIPAGRLRRLWIMMAHLQGEPVNISKLAANLEIKRSLVNHYVDILIDLLLIRRLDPWHENVKKRLVKSPRYYIRDSGIQHRLLGIHDEAMLLSNPVLGKSWEGFVIENIHSVLPYRIQTYFYRTSAGAEIDLIIRLSSSEIWAIEIKYGLTPRLNPHYANTCADVGATHKYVVYGGDDEFPVGGDVWVISLPKLMEKLLLKIKSD